VKRAVQNGTISSSLLEEKVKKILTYKFILNVHKFDPIDKASIYNKVNNPSAEWIKRKIYDDAVTLVKNDSSIIPITKLEKIKIASVTIGASKNNKFQAYLKKYANVSAFQIMSASELTSLRQLKDYD